MPRLTDLIAELRSLRIDRLHKILLGIIVVLASLFWLTPYKYSYHTVSGAYGTAPMRINRLSGKAEVLGLAAGGYEWVAVMTHQEPKEPVKFTEPEAGRFRLRK
jgi:hypothetical protein